jgi:class 3 adenylate cyclase
LSTREFHYRWKFDLKSSPEQLWPFIADTNRFNRDRGVPHIDVEKEQKRRPNARRKVRLSIYGMPLEWEEQPFEWVKPSRFGIERVYSKGPMARLRVRAELNERPDGGTDLTYELWATPRNLIGSVAIPSQIKFITEPRFRSAIREYDKLAVTPGLTIVPRDRDTSLSSFDLSRLQSLHQKLIESIADTDQADRKRVIADRLADFIEHADDFDVARIRAYKLADNWREPRRLVLEMCLRATRIGLLDFKWDLLCPLCRGPQESPSSLKDINSHVHCEACQIDFTVDFDRYVELTFHPNAAVRRVQVESYCVGSPQLTPHVVAQQLLPPGDKRELTLPLEPGRYRLRTHDLPGSQEVIVSEDGEKSAQATVLDHGLDHQPLHVAEEFSLTLENKTAAEQLVMLERMAWTDQATTAAEVTALQMFRDLFSSEALRPGEQISVGTLTVLFTDLRDSTKLYREIGDATAFGRVMGHFDVLRKSITERDGAIVKTIGDAVMAVFRNAADGVSAMLEAQQTLANPAEGVMPLKLKAGLHTGPCIAVTLNDRLDYFGSTVNMAARLEGLSTGRDLIISRSVYEDRKVRELLDSQGLTAIEFEAMLKGFEDEAQLWRVSSKPE